ncbi:MAG: hypothetical protein QNK37_39015 [Acidobacteriota bacterium]|nr:hypothetical protein [Acidobacteriota bacterium]
MKKITNVKAFTVLAMVLVVSLGTFSLASGSWNLTGSAGYFAGRVWPSLSWNAGASSASSVDVFRDGNKIATTSNNGSWSGYYFGPSSGSANYWVCDAGSTTWYNSATCSNVRTVTW